MTPPAGACLSRLTLTDFRCYEALRLETDAKAIVLTGPNGAGKTNVLEAISLLTPGRGLRNAKTTEIGRKSADGQPRRWGAAAVVDGPGGESTLGVGCDPETQGERRKVQVDGAPARGQAALAERFSALWLTPQMDRLFIDGAEERRRYLDRLAATFDPAHIGRVSNYRNAMRQRLSLLKEGRADPTWLDALEAEMAARAVAVAAARNETALLLDTAAAEGVGAFPRASVIVDGTAERLLESGPALAAEDVLRAKLAADRSRDAQLGATATGPHRSDMVVADRARGLRAADGSTGEQKALLVSLTFASARMLATAKGAAPVLLLDEVAAHFDPARRAALFDEALALGGQVWVTGADEDQLRPLKGRADWRHLEAATVSDGAEQ
ncbi:MAG: DNA replication/repair protein RecF [Alphaproteobacteria bacterium]|nr:DNA replication/repair protein RecF [Alphaproteobacteria bacterium]